MLKRSVDFILAGLLLVIALPLLAVAAIIIKWDSEGPVIFRQVRMGRRFQSFYLLKLRTMRPSLDGPDYTLGADARITGPGRWLRRFKLDELPQLWNCLLYTSTAGVPPDIYAFHRYTRNSTHLSHTCLLYTSRCV